MTYYTIIKIIIMSKATTSKKSKGNEKANVMTEVTHEEAKVFVQKMESRLFISNDDDSEELTVPDGDFVFDRQDIAQLGYDSDNDDTILRGEAETDSGNGVAFSDTMNDSPDFNDSDDDEENIKALKSKYKAAQKATA